MNKIRARNNWCNLLTILQIGDFIFELGDSLVVFWGFQHPKTGLKHFMLKKKLPRKVSFNISTFLSNYSLFATSNYFSCIIFQLAIDYSTYQRQRNYYSTNLSILNISSCSDWHLFWDAKILRTREIRALSSYKSSFFLDCSEVF